MCEVWHLFACDHVCMFASVCVCACHTHSHLLSCLLNVVTHRRVDTSHTRTLSSAEPVARRLPSGEKAQHLTEPECPLNVPAQSSEYRNRVTYVST